MYVQYYYNVFTAFPLQAHLEKKLTRSAFAKSRRLESKVNWTLHISIIATMFNNYFTDSVWELGNQFTAVAMPRRESHQAFNQAISDKDKVKF